MITTVELLSSGLRIGKEIPTDNLNEAIDTAWLYVVKSGMSDADFSTLASLSHSSNEYVGGIITIPGGATFYCAGLKRALAHITFACLLRQNINATNFGSVQKKDDYSYNAEPFEVAKYNMTIGISYLRDVCRATGTKWKNTESTLINTL